MKAKLLFAVLVLALVLPAASSLKIEEKSYDFQIVGNSVYVEETINFGGSVTGTFMISIPDDAEGISLYIDNQAAKYANHVRLSSAKNIRINYITKTVLDKSNFLANIQSAHNITSLKITLALEEGTSIRREKDNGLSSPSIFPEPDEITSDGQSIILVWEKQDFINEEGFPIYVRVKARSSAASTIVIILIIAAIGYVSVRMFLQKTSKKSKPEHEKKEEKHEQKAEEKLESEIPNSRSEASRKHEEKREEKAHEVLEHLKDEEQQIVRVLKAREGSCEQGTLRVVTGFSKAHLSRLLCELEVRKVIFKEKRGKKNLVFLK